MNPKNPTKSSGADECELGKKIIALRKRGYLIREIVKEIGVSQSTVSAYLYPESTKRKRENFNKKHSRRSQIWDKNHRGGKRAHDMTWRAVKKGTLVPKPCVICGEKVVQPHHEDYLKPLEVVWLCRSHHQKLHWKNKK